MKNFGGKIYQKVKKSTKKKTILTNQKILPSEEL